MSETTLTELEQREIRMYIRDSVGGADIDTDRLPRWLAHLVEAERERDQLRAERDALKEELEKAQGARQWIDPAERLPEDGVEVLVCLYWGGVATAQHAASVPQWETTSGYYFHGAVYREVIGWMPLPAALEESG